MVTSEDMDIIGIPPTESAGTSDEKNISKTADKDIINLGDDDVDMGLLDENNKAADIQLIEATATPSAETSEEKIVSESTDKDIDLGDDVEMGLLEENSETANIQLDQMDEDYIDELLAPESAENATDEEVAPPPTEEEDPSDELTIIEPEVVSASEDSHKENDTIMTEVEESSNSEEAIFDQPEKSKSPSPVTEVELPASSEQSGSVSIFDLLNDVIAAANAPSEEVIVCGATTTIAPADDVIAMDDIGLEMINDASEPASIETASTIPVLNRNNMNISADSDDIIFVESDDNASNTKALLPPPFRAIESARAPVDDEIVVLSDGEETADVEMESVEKQQASLQPQAALDRSEPVIGTGIQAKVMQVIRATMTNRPEVAGCAVLREEMNSMEDALHAYSDELEETIVEIRETNDMQKKKNERETAATNRKIRDLEATVSSLMQKCNAQKQDSNGRVAPPSYRASLVSATPSPQQVQRKGPYSRYTVTQKSPVRIQNGGGGPIRAFSTIPQRVTPRAISVAPARLVTPRTISRPVAPPTTPSLPTKLNIDIPLEPNPRASLVNDPFDSLPVRDYPPGLAKLPRDSVEIQLTTEYDNFIISKKIHGSIRYNLRNNDCQGKSFRIYYFIESMHNNWQYSDTGAVVPSNTNKFTLSFDKNQKLYSGDRITFIGYVFEEMRQKYVSDRVVFNFRRPSQSTPMVSASDSFADDEDSEIRVL